MKNTFTSFKKPSLQKVKEQTRKRIKIESEIEKAYQLQQEARSLGRDAGVCWMPNGEGGYSPYVFDLNNVFNLESKPTRLPWYRWLF